MKSISEAMPFAVRQAIDNGVGNIIIDDPVYICSTCQDLGLLSYGAPVGDPLFGKLHPCPECARGLELQARQWKNRLTQAALPEMYQGMTFDTWQQLPAALKVGKQLAYWCAGLFAEAEDHNVNLARAYELCGRTLGYDVWRKSLILQGTWGVGKTGLAAAIINTLIAQKRPALYIRTQDFLESVKARFGKDDPPSVEDVMQTVKTAPVLVLDEFNMVSAGEWRQETIENIMRYRYGNNLPTVVTCNASKDELTAQWGGRTTHVLFAMAHWLPMGGPVLRDLRSTEGRPF